MVSKKYAIKSYNPLKNLLTVLSIIFVVMNNSACAFRKDPTSEKKVEKLDMNKVLKIQKEVLSTDEFQGESILEPSVPDLSPITLKNLSEITEIKKISPSLPDFYHISKDQKRAALGNLDRIRILDLNIEKQIFEILVELSDCEFGANRFFRLNADGSFIGIVTDLKIQVWEVGGGLIYENAFDRRFNTDKSHCGADVPEIALSPDGRKLAISGIRYSRDSAKEFFQVISILENEVLYEWDGNEKSPHGKLYAFAGLGFSHDGNLLQTFDPSKYFLESGKAHLAFRFWSVGDWVEITGDLKQIVQRYSKGDLLFSVADFNSLEVRSRLDSDIIADLTDTGCSMDVPCETLFSPDGKKILVLSRLNSMNWVKNQAIASKIKVYDLLAQKEPKILYGEFRNLDGVFFTQDGPVHVKHGNYFDTGSKTWWTYATHFSGLLQDNEGNIIFHPGYLSLKEENQAAYYGQCEYDVELMEVECSSELHSVEGIALALEQDGENFQLIQSNGKIDLFPPDFFNAQGVAELRFLGFSSKAEIGFFCRDLQNRMSRCIIYDFEDARSLYEGEDFSYLRFSPDGRSASFIDMDRYILIIIDLDSKEIIERTSYRSRAYGLNPEYTDNGRILINVVQNQDDPDVISIDWINASTYKVEKRTGLNIIADGLAAFSAHPSIPIWAFADHAGFIHLINAENRKEMVSFQAHFDNIIGISFNLDGKQLVSMGENGMIKVWGIPN